MWYKLLDTTVYLTYMVQLMVSSVGKIKLTQKIVFINDLPPRKEKRTFFKKDSSQRRTSSNISTQQGSY